MLLHGATITGAPQESKNAGVNRVLAPARFALYGYSVNVSLAMNKVQTRAITLIPILDT